MSAPTPAPGDDRPREGYYPDPSIPGYVRYWNGAAWVPGTRICPVRERAAGVPGTSRPAPSDGEPLPAPPRSATAPAPSAAPAAAEETGPVFFDEEPGGVTQTGPDTEATPAADPDAVAGTGGSGAGTGGSGAGRASGSGAGQHGARPEPASAWQADAARQTGLGGEQDQRVSWGAPGQRDPRVPGDGAA
ncbi:DUF2510 domain-containing protein, partial [Streptomyces aurantiacus]|uniref:DUF2510 domain-containing protein n=1 Tax=Streptomyces aurantiacus TaxID=47760 RepID=UPI001319E2BA